VVTKNPEKRGKIAQDQCLQLRHGRKTQLDAVIAVAAQGGPRGAG
jgi:hypothetical protein